MARAKKSLSQYEKVKETLNRLQGKKVPSYQGLHAFWLDPDVFKTASLYGQRLIAPDPGAEPSGAGHGNGKSCCGSGNPALSDPAVAAVQEPPTNTSIGNCWPSGGSGGGGTDPGPSRSSRSAIILGLRGQYPFDGSIYPKLLWDADHDATEDEIQIVANWIDAGCPVNKEQEAARDSKSVAELNLRNKKVALAMGDMEHPVSTNKTNKDQQANKGIQYRKEIHSLTDDELKIYREALACMYTYNDYWQDERSYDFWGRIHTNSCQHGWEQFLPWHRLYLYFFEQKLQDYDSGITIPYWDWAAYYEHNKTTFNNTEPDLGYLPPSFGCWLTAEGFHNLSKVTKPDGKKLFNTKEIAGLKAMVGKDASQSGLRFLTQAKLKYEVTNPNDSGVVTWSDKVKAVYNELRRINPLWFPNRWPGAMGSPTTYPNKQDIQNLMALENFADFGGGPSYDHHFGSLEKVHNGMHNFSGGTNPCYPYSDPSDPTNPQKNNKKWIKIYNDLSLTADPQAYENPQYGWMTDNRITAFDPLFWSHHSNVDRIWARWQKLHNGTPEGMTGAMAPWSLTVADSMSTTQLGYKYLRDSKYFDVANDLSVQKFKSAKTGVSQTTLDNHSRAELKIHRVRRGNLPNARIRLFLNHPGADANTKTVGNDHFIEEITTFHGSCYGGPGHCDLPLDKTRSSDLRPLHHHEPRNFKVNATEAVQRMLEKGEKDISVQMVVTGIDGRPIDNAIYMDGISLNFFD